MNQNNCPSALPDLIALAEKCRKLASEHRTLYFLASTQGGTTPALIESAELLEEVHAALSTTPPAARLSEGEAEPDVDEILLAAGTTGERQVWFTRKETEEAVRAALSHPDSSISAKSAKARDVK